MALGLIPALLERGFRVGYMKPVGQRVVRHGQVTVDEDVLLVRDIYDVRGRVEDASPIGIPKGFTERYIHGKIDSHLSDVILKSFRGLAKECDVVIIEGTGHAGVGSVIDLSNARVAHMLEAEVLIVTLGGIGRPYDEVSLNCSLFRHEGVEVLGVVANKVLPAKMDKVRENLGLAFRKLDIQLLGAMPTVAVLSGPTLAQVSEDVGARLLSRARDLSRTVHNVVVGTSSPEFAVRHFDDSTLLITSGDREDLIEAALQFAQRSSPDGQLVGVVLTDGLVPGEQTMHALEQARVPVLRVDRPCYDVAHKIHDLLVKIRPSDSRKIEIVRQLVRDHVDVDRIVEKMGLEIG